MIRTFTSGPNTWTVRELDGQLGYEVAGLAPVWIRAPRPLEEMTDDELVELLWAELEPQQMEDE